MTTENLKLRGRGRTGTQSRERWPWYAAGTVGAIFAGWVLSHGITGVAGTRVANPAAPRDAAPLSWGGLSVDHFWIPVFYAVTLAVMALMVWQFVKHYRATGRHHAGLPIFIVLFLQILMDPLYNWAMYCAYYPNLLHWPVNWSVMNVAPTVEPLWIVMGAYQVFFLGPAWGGFVLYRKWAARREGRTAWVDRHPVLTMFLFTWVLGGIADILMEQWMINMYIYKYTQIAGPAFTLGHGRLQWAEVVWVGFLIAVCALMLHRDDTGRTIGARIAQRNGWLRGHRIGAAFVTVSIVTVALLAYGGYWATLRLTGNADHIAPGNWPYAAARTYDPNGRLQRAHVGGPLYFSGTWCTGSRCGAS
jgi:Spirocyclase AveC-like